MCVSVAFFKRVYIFESCLHVICSCPTESFVKVYADAWELWCRETYRHHQLVASVYWTCVHASDRRCICHQEFGSIFRTIRTFYEMCIFFSEVSFSEKWFSWVSFSLEVVALVILRGVGERFDPK